MVFDDFGVEYQKDGGILEAFIDEIFWYREGDRLPTIVTTNLDPEAMKQRLSARVIDRLRGEWGRSYRVPGASLRSRNV